MPDEPEAALMQRPNQSLIVAVVTKHSPCGIDSTAERGLGDNPAIPDGLEKFILADNSVTVTHQMNDEVEDLGLNMHRFPQPAQLLLAEVDLEPGK